MILRKMRFFDIKKSFVISKNVSGKGAPISFEAVKKTDSPE